MDVLSASRIRISQISPLSIWSSRGRLCSATKEVAALRKYLLNGGFLMLDDFWGDSEWKMRRK